MKKLALVTAIALASVCRMASAADTQTVGVTASIQSICKFSGAAATVAFGLINPSDAAGVKSKVLTVPYKCTKGFTPSITTGTIVPLTLAATGETMVFTVDAFVTTAGTGFTAAVNGTSNVNIASTVWQNASAGDYVGSVVLDINN